MKALKLFFLFGFIALLLLSNPIIAQERQELDKYPMPKGGMEALIKNVVYPEAAKKEGIDGKVYVKAIIDENGNVVKAEAINLLEDAAVKAVKSTKFEPGVKDGKKVKAEVTVPIAFKLK